MNRRWPGEAVFAIQEADVKNVRSLVAICGVTMVAVLSLVGACSEDSSDGGSTAAGASEVETSLDLMAMAHLADVDHGGLFIDFGTPAQSKYTAGDWNAGWGSRGNDGDVTYANAGRRGRVYFQADEPAELQVSMRLKPIGTGALTPYLNNQQVQSVFFEADGWQTVQFTLPAEDVRRGENYLLLTFGGVAGYRGEDVSVQVESMRIGRAIDAGMEMPAWGTYVGPVALGDVQRESVVNAAPTSFRWYVEVPENGRLDFGVGQEGAAGGTARVKVRSDDANEQTLFEQGLSAEWHDAQVDLSRYAGEVVQLELSATGGSGRVAWSTPRLVVPEQEPVSIENARNVVVVLCDTLRASKLQVWNPSSRVRTPALDQLAAESAVFERGQSTENWTKPAVASILTGLHPIDHDARTQSAVLNDNALMISEHFKSNGFATGGFIANGYISDRFGFDQGWDRYRNFIRESGASSEAEDVFREAGDWAVEHKDERFFLYVHTIDPHVPYDPENEFVSMYDERSDYEGQVRPRMTGELLANAKRNPPRVTFSPSDVRRLEALHDGEITQHDRHMGAFIERLKENGLWEDTVFVFVADHGEEFAEHDSWGHGHSIYQELLHVPLLVHYGDHVPAGRIPQRVSTMDIGPTVLELAGLPAMPDVAARSLVPLLHGQSRVGPEVAMSEFLDERRVMTTERWKFFIRGNLTVSMFDLQNDGAEQNQLDVWEHPIAARYLRILQGQFLGSSDRSHWLDADQRAGRALQSSEVEMDAELQQQLRELGYLN